MKRPTARRRRSKGTGRRRAVPSWWCLTLIRDSGGLVRDASAVRERVGCLRGLLRRSWVWAPYARRKCGTVPMFAHRISTGRRGRLLRPSGLGCIHGVARLPVVRRLARLRRSRERDVGFRDGGIESDRRRRIKDSGVAVRHARDRRLVHLGLAVEL